MRSSEGWNEKSKPARVDGRELGHTKRHLDASVLAQRQFLGEQGIDHFERTGFAALELADGLIKNFQSSRHRQTDQGSADAVEDRRDDLQGRTHDWSPWQARRRPTAW